MSPSGHTVRVSSGSQFLVLAAEFIPHGRVADQDDVVSPLPVILAYVAVPPVNLKVSRSSGGFASFRTYLAKTLDPSVCAVRSCSGMRYADNWPAAVNPLIGRVYIFHNIGWRMPLEAGRHAEAADAWQLQRRPANIKSEDGTKEIDLKAFNPTNRETKITPKGSVGAGAGGC